MQKSVKGASRGELTCESSQEKETDIIMLGAVLRIADATELMAKNYLSLQSSNVYLSDINKRMTEEIKNLKNSLRAEKAAKTRFKNKLS